MAGGVLEIGHGDARRGREQGTGPVGVVAVEAEQAVEMDHAAVLIFGGLAVREPDERDPAAVALAVVDPDEQATLDGELAEATLDGLLGAPPQFPGVVVPHDLAGVVVAVQAQRLAEPGIVAAVPSPADQGPAVRADLGVVPSVAGFGLAAAVGPIGAGVLPDGPGVH